MPGTHALREVSRQDPGSSSSPPSSPRGSHSTGPTIAPCFPQQRGVSDSRTTSREHGDEAERGVVIRGFRGGEVRGFRGRGTVYSFHAWPKSYGHRPSQPYKTSGWSKSGFPRPGIHRVHQARSAVRGGGGGSCLFRHSTGSAIAPWGPTKKRRSQSPNHVT